LFAENAMVSVDWLKIHLGLTTIVRAPQYRNSVFVAWSKRHPCLGSLLRRIRDAVDGRTNALSTRISRAQNRLLRTMAEPRRTLELTGPGAFTDECGAGQGGGVAVVASHAASAHFIVHRGLGTWKKNGR
jgi:hypothetical protein